MHDEFKNKGNCRTQLESKCIVITPVVRELEEIEWARFDAKMERVCAPCGLEAERQLPAMKIAGKSDIRISQLF